jgi:hypothetical protein
VTKPVTIPMVRHQGGMLAGLSPYPASSPHKTCQWIFNDDPKEPDFCGAPSVPGHSWCADHLDRISSKRDGEVIRKALYSPDHADLAYDELVLPKTPTGHLFTFGRAHGKKRPPPDQTRRKM